MRLCRCERLLIDLRCVYRIVRLSNNDMNFQRPTNRYVASVRKDRMLTLSDFCNRPRSGMIYLDANESGSRMGCVVHNAKLMTEKYYFHHSKNKAYERQDRSGADGYAYSSSFISFHVRGSLKQLVPFGNLIQNAFRGNLRAYLNVHQV